MAQPLPPPPVKTPMVDPKTGMVTPIWQRWLTQFASVINERLTAGGL